MPSKKFDVTWKAEPHTIAKIKLLQAYLKAWLSILGISRRGEQLLYVDGFAGPGEYTNYPTGSPIAAIDAAKSVLATHGDKWIAGDVHCAFIDAAPDRIAHLTRKVNQTPKPGRVHTYIHGVAFVDGLALVKKESASTVLAAPSSVRVCRSVRSHGIPVPYNAGNPQQPLLGGADQPRWRRHRPHLQRRQRR